MGSRKHCPSFIYSDPADADCPWRRIVYAVYHRAALDLRSPDPDIRCDAEDFWAREGLDWRDVMAGRRRWEWLRR